MTADSKQALDELTAEAEKNGEYPCSKEPLPEPTRSKAKACIEKLRADYFKNPERAMAAGVVDCTCGENYMTQAEECSGCRERDDAEQLTNDAQPEVDALRVLADRVNRWFMFDNAPNLLAMREALDNVRPAGARRERASAPARGERFVEFRMETFSKWLAKELPRIHVNDHGRVTSEVESIATDAERIGYARGVEDGAKKERERFEAALRLYFDHAKGVPSSSEPKGEK